MKILITGGSGLVGRSLTALLVKQGHQVSWLSQSKNKSSDVPVFYYDWKVQQIDLEAFEGVDAIVHLAGFNVAERTWSSSVRQAILESRVESSRLIFNSLSSIHHQVKTFVSASAIGYYGTFTSETILTEDSPKGNDFLARVCVEWERSVDAFETLNIRTVKVRTGIVLSLEGGALPSIKKPFKYGAKVILGTGNQYFPWIHIDDLCSIYAKALEDLNMRGVYNAVAPECVNYRQLIEHLSLAYPKLFVTMKVPKWFLKLVLGEQSDMLIKGTRIAPKNLQNMNFQFQYPDLLKAVESKTI